MPDPASVDDLCAHLAASKLLVGPFDWKRVNTSERIGTTIEIDGIITRGLGFCITCVKERPDEKVTIVLLVDYKGKPRPFARIDWRGAAHENNRPCCGVHRFTNAGRTHFHDTDLHRHIEIDEFFQPKMDIPIATSIQPEPASFAELLAISSELLHIENLREIPVPPWSPQTSFT